MASEDKGALDDESVVREPDLQRGVVEIQSRAMLGKRLQCLIELPAQAHDVRTCAQGDPVEVDGRCEAPSLLIHAGRQPSRHLSITPVGVPSAAEQAPTPPSARPVRSP